MSNELTPDLREHLEFWTQIQNEFESVKNQNNNFEIIITNLKEECKASRASEKALSALVNDLRKQVIDNIQEKSSIENELKKKIEKLNFTSQEFKRYENEKKELCDQIEILKNDLRRQATEFKDEQELMQSHYLFQISELNEEIHQMKNEKSNDLNNMMMDYENKLSRFHLPFQQLEEENSKLLQKLKEKEIENSILTENLKQKQMEILGLRNKIDNIEQPRSTLHQQKINHSHLNKNHDNTAKQSESKNSGIMPNEKQSKKKETPLKVVFNQANKKISPIYKMANSSFALKKNAGKKKVPGNENSSFNGGCVYPTNNKVISATSFRKSTSATSPTEKRNLEPRDNENEPPLKKGSPHFYSPINSQETDDEKSNRKRPPKKRALFSHSKFETEEEVLLDDDPNNE